VKVKAYQSYQESRVEWFSAVPDHWEVLPCRAIVDERNEKNEGLKSDFYLSLLANIGIIPYEEKGDIGNKKPEDLEKCKLVERGDLVINSMNYGIGSFGLSELSGVCSPVYIVLRPKSEMIEERFALRIFECRDFQTYAQSFGNGILAHRAAINWDILKVLRLPVPPRSEQNLILQYLDQETAKIDALVAEQERLIALLKEKRQAVISQAVTKGLNPNAPMKDSGIEWLGQVPAHWEIRMLKRAFRSVDYGISDALSPEGEIVVLRMNNIQNGSISFEDLKYTDSVDPQLLLEAGDLLYNRTNSLELIGKVGVYKGEFDMPLSFASYLVRFRLFDGAPDYFAYLLNTRGILGIVRSSAYVAIGQCNLNPTKYGEISVALPAPEEQAAIVDFLNAEVSRTDTLITEATQAITLLRERRAALISAAVTGKIDVRALAPSQPEAA
jgi:type I restriction enzyme S subunit